MFGKFMMAAAVLGVAGVASASETGVNAGKVSRSDRVIYAPVGSARTAVPVHVAGKAEEVARPYALTGNVPARRLVPIYIGSRFVGMRQASGVGQ